MKEIENALYQRGLKYVAGIDEAGRGPLAGPVCAAAVILPREAVIEGIADSKKLSEKKREKLFDEIVRCAVAYSVQFVDAETIDAINIRRATHLAMQRAAEGLAVPPEHLIVDGNDNLPFSIPYDYIVKGDAKSQSIAAASILAKVSRDRLMKELDLQFPQYGFARHKGYGTQQHMEALRAYGASALHRQTFLTDKVMGR